MDHSTYSFEKLQLAQPGPSRPDIAKEVEKLERNFDKLDMAGKKKEIREFLSLMDGHRKKIQSVRSLNGDHSEDEHERWNRQVADAVSLLAHRHGVDILDMFDNAMGSGLRGEPLADIRCANVYVHGKICPKVGQMQCSRCRVVKYCSKECQKEHWKVFHKKECTQSIASKDWTPAYIQELRSPAFSELATGQAAFTAFGKAKVNYLWGNTPAVDILRLSEMEGPKYDKPINLLFAAAGDIRNALTTIAGLPTDYPKKLRIVINDREPLVALRAFTFLRSLEEFGEDAIDAVIQLWYSAAVTSKQWIQTMKLLHDTFTPGFKSATHAANLALLQQTDKQVRSHFGQEVLRVAAWVMHPQFTLQNAVTARNQVMLAPGRVDYRHRYMQSMTPGERICFEYFRHHGLLLPYGALDADHNTANKLLIDPAVGWVMMDSADPLNGWDLSEVRKSGRAHGVPLDDQYGCLFFHLRDLMTKVVHRMRSLDLSIDVYCEDVRDLCKKLGGRRFDRIDTSNIADKGYLGLTEVLNLFSPKMNVANPKTTLFTGFMNWSHSPPDAWMKKITREVAHDMLAKADGSTMMDPRARHLITSIALVKADYLAKARYDATKDFRKYLDDSQNSVKDAKVRMRMKNAVLPRRIHGKMDGNQEEVRSMTEEEYHLAVEMSGLTLLERTVEWEPVV